MTEPLAALFNAVRSRRELERLAKAQTEAQRRERADAEHQKDKEKDDAKELDDLIFMIEIQRQIAEIEERMARNYEILRTTYGDDVVGGMAATWLSREEAAKLTTDDDRMRALSGIFLNDDDSIKPPYAGVVDAQYVQDWTVLGKLKHEKEVTPEAGVGLRQPASEDTSSLNTVNKPLF